MERFLCTFMKNAVVLIVVTLGQLEQIFGEIFLLYAKYVAF